MKNSLLLVGTVNYLDTWTIDEQFLLERKLKLRKNNTIVKCKFHTIHNRIQNINFLLTTTVWLPLPLIEALNYSASNVVTHQTIQQNDAHICTAGQEFINLNPMTLYAGNLKLKSQLCLTSDLCIQGTCWQLIWQEVLNWTEYPCHSTTGMVMYLVIKMTGVVADRVSKLTNWLCFHCRSTIKI